MEISWNTNYIDLQNVINISKGDSTRLLKYLNQFKELIPDRLYLLKQALYTEDRKQIRQVLHKMSPQLQFFGIKNIKTPIESLEYEYQTMPFSEMKVLVNNIILRLEEALMEVNATIVTYFE